MTNPEEFARLAAVDGDADVGIVITARLHADDSISLSVGVAGRGSAVPVEVVRSMLDLAAYQVGERLPTTPMRITRGGGH
jgi:hypothetical protein